MSTRNTTSDFDLLRPWVELTDPDKTNALEAAAREIDRRVSEVVLHYSDLTGAFKRYETVTGGISGGSGQIAFDNGKNRLNLNGVAHGGSAGSPQPLAINETITGGTSGATAIIRRKLGIPQEEEKDLELLLAGHIACGKEPYAYKEREGDVSAEYAWLEQGASEKVEGFGLHTSPYGAEYRRRLKQFLPITIGAV